MSLQVGFYNIGWTDTQLSGQNREMHRKQLGRDCARAFESNDLGMLCLCEVGNNKLDENLHAHLGNSAGFQDKYPFQDVNRWLEQVIQECCKTSIDLQAYILGPRPHLSPSTSRRRATWSWSRATRSQFLFALMRQPSFFKAEGLEKLLDDWASTASKAATRAARAAAPTAAAAATTAALAAATTTASHGATQTATQTSP